jgi:hypothetical protein
VSQKFFAYHLGVQGVLGRKLNRFYQNRRLKLTAAGIHAPTAKDYRPYLRDFVWQEGVGFAQQPQALEMFKCPSDYRGITLSNDQALSGRRTLYENGEFLYWAEERIEKISSLFADHRIIFLLEVENFATFLPKHLEELEAVEIDRISAWPLADFVWSDLIDGIKTTCPDAEIIVAPTEVIATKTQEIISKMTAEAIRPRPAIPDPISREAIEEFQLAIGERMSVPIPANLSEHLYDVMGWDQQTRVLLSRQYYSEILKLYHSCTLIL